jgi:hypothetical protein
MKVIIREAAYDDLDRIPEVSVAVRSSRPSCSKAEKREYSWQIGGHPGNPGLELSTFGRRREFRLKLPHINYLQQVFKSRSALNDFVHKMICITLCPKIAY